MVLTSFGLVLSLVFFGGGVSRIVEFTGVGLSGRIMSLFRIIHILGCLCFSSSMALMSVDVHEHHRGAIGALFFSSLVLLLPIHLFTGLKRRIRLKERADRGLAVELRI